MNVVRKDIDANNATLTINVKKADYDDSVNKQLKDLRKKANIPGFRPGHVPLGMIKKMYGNSVKLEEINKIVSEELFKYIQENKLNYLGEPLPSETEQKEINFDTQDDYEFVFDIGLAPEFEVILNKKNRIKFYEIMPNDEMVNNQIKSYTGRYGKYVQEETVEEKDMVKGKLVELVNGKIKKDGLTVEDAVLTPAYLKNEDIKKSFDKAKVGDVITVNPQKAFDSETEVVSFLKIGKDQLEEINMEFEYTIEGITRYYEAELDQELFDKVYGDGTVKSEEEFKEKIKADIQTTLNQDSEYKFSLDAKEYIVNRFKDLTYPDAFLKRWLKASNKEMEEDKIEEEYPKMIEDLTWQLVKNKLAETHEIEVTKEEVEDFARQVARSQFAQYGMIGVEDAILDNYVQDMLKEEKTISNFVDRVHENKVLAVIKEAVKIDTQEISIEEFNKMFEA